MEFPDLGQHCSETTCRQIDFLPVKCDACQSVFCGSHFSYSSHACPSAYRRDVQVPVCPLCNAPVPVSRGQVPDVAVSAHMDAACRSGRARRVYTNRCNKRGCNKKELVKVTCDRCTLNFCLTHRHASDHDCRGPAAATSRAGLAALQRLQSAHHGSGPSSGAAGSSAGGAARALQAGLSDDEALARALQASLASPQAEPAAGQLERDMQLARALQAAEEQAVAAAGGAARPTRPGAPTSCHIS